MINLKMHIAGESCYDNCMADVSKKSIRGRYSEVQKRATKKYKAAHVKSVGFNLNKIYDAELIEIYDLIPKKSEWFKNCIRAYAREQASRKVG